MFGQKEWSDVQGTGGVSFLLSAAPCSPAVAAARLAFATTHKYQPQIFTWLSLWLFFLPRSCFYKAGGVILGCVKMSEHTCLKQKCPNKARDHKSAIVNLGETKLPSTRIYLFCTNRQLTPGKKKNLFIPPPLKFMSKKTQTLPS